MIKITNCYRLRRADFDHLDEVINGDTANGLCGARDPWAKPATDSVSVEHNVTEVRLFARPLAELATPPTMGHQAETSTTTVADLMLADLRLSHHTLLQLFDRVFVDIWYKVRGGSCFVICRHLFVLAYNVEGRWRMIS